MPIHQPTPTTAQRTRRRPAHPAPAQRTPRARDTVASHRFTFPDVRELPRPVQTSSNADTW